MAKRIPKRITGEPDGRRGAGPASAAFVRRLNGGSNAGFTFRLTGAMACRGYKPSILLARSLPIFQDGSASRPSIKSESHAAAAGVRTFTPTPQTKGETP